MLRWKTRLEAVAGVTLVSVAAYMLVRGSLFR
jgi:hypothetical protein